jgi:hypothetical protein
MPGMPPDVLIVFDKSGSMNECVIGLSGCVPDQPTPGSKYTQLTGALSNVLLNTQATVNWGLMLFPSDAECGAGSVGVPVGPGNAGAISALLGSRPPEGGTPTAGSLDAARGYMLGRGSSRPQYLLLATDGAPNCGAPVCQPPLQPCTLFDGSPGCDDGFDCFPANDADEGSAIAACRAAAEAGVKVFVVGVVGGFTPMDQGTLDQMAVAGGVPRPGAARRYYEIASATDLQAALMAITGQIFSCSYALDAAPPDPAQVSVSVNGQPVPRDPQNGWDLAPDLRSIVFSGEACRSLQMQPSLDLRATFGCPPIGKPR